MCRDVLYPYAFLVRPIFAKRCKHAHGKVLLLLLLSRFSRVQLWEDLERYQIWTGNQANQNDWPKQTQKKYSIKVVQAATSVPVHTYSTLFLLINALFHYFPSSWKFFFCRAEGPEPLSLTTDPGARIWCFTAVSLPQSLAGSPGPTPRYRRMRPSELSRC